jgi:hypothetical protein
MFRIASMVASWSILSFSLTLIDGVAKPDVNAPGPVKPDRTWLWVDPTNRTDTYYGLGSKDRQPRGDEFTFVEEDTDGVNPKYVVTDADGVKWKLKIGLEARPEVAASRLLWAAGYHTHEDYFVPALHVLNLPEHLHRGKNLIGPGGTMRNARMRRYRDHEKKVGWWNWTDCPFSGTREFNGLRTLMALINNWDTKDVNTAIYDNWKATPERPVRMYMVSDLGSSFGETSLSWNQEHIKGNLDFYSRSKFITSTTPDRVSFSVPGNFRIDNGTVVQYLFRRPRQWITKDVPRADARWIGHVLARLTPAQIRDIFRAAGYSPEVGEGFARALEARIAELCAI